jgi:hypothetical protein
MVRTKKNADLSPVTELNTRIEKLEQRLDKLVAEGVYNSRLRTKVGIATLVLLIIIIIQNYCMS